MRTINRLATITTSTVLAAGSLIGSSAAAHADTLKPLPVDGVGCSTGYLPVEVVGADGVKAQAPEGFYLWHGLTGYALRVTHPGKEKVVFSGTITVTNELTQIHAVDLEPADSLKVGPYRHTLTFSFTNYGGIDGVNFAANCSKDVKVTLDINGALAGASSINLGKGEAHPTSNPFTIERSTKPVLVG